MVSVEKQYIYNVYNLMSVGVKGLIYTHETITTIKAHKHIHLLPTFPPASFIIAVVRLLTFLVVRTLSIRSTCLEMLSVQSSVVSYGHHAVWQPFDHHLPQPWQPPFSSLRFYIRRVSEIRQHSSLCVWLISFCMTSSRYTHVVTSPSADFSAPHHSAGLSHNSIPSVFMFHWKCQACLCFRAFAFVLPCLESSFSTCPWWFLLITQVSAKGCPGHLPSKPWSVPSPHLPPSLHS